MHFQALGTLVVLVDGAVLDVRPGRQRLLLACLLAHAGATVSFDLLTEALWPDGAPHVDADLRPVASRLRRCLDAEAGGRDRLVTRRGGYELRVGPDELDVFVAEAQVARGRQALRQGRHPEARDLLTSALATWRGTAYADFADTVLLQPEVARLEELRRSTVEDLVDVELALGRASDALSTLGRLIADEPFRERPQGQLMLALYRCGRQAEALQAYRGYRRLLSEELGLFPGPRLAELEQRILRHDPDLDHPGQPVADEPRARGRRLLEVGESQRRSGGPYRRTLLEAGDAGMSVGDDDVLVAAALAGGRGTFSRLGEVDRDRVRLIEAALAVARSDRARARLLAALSAELTFEPGGRRARAAAEDAMGCARQARDPRTEIGVVLECVTSALGDPEVQEERRAWVRDVAGLVDAHGDVGHRFWLASVQSVCAVESFDAEALDQAQGRMTTASEELGEPMAACFAAVSGSWAALLRGDRARAARLSERAAEIGAEIGQRDAWLIHQVQLVHLAWHDGDPEAMLEAAMRSAGSTRFGDARVAWSSALAGRRAAATEMLERACAAGFPSSARIERLTDLCAWAEAAVGLRHRGAAERLLTLLGPWSGSIAATGGVVYPCVAHHVGRLASLCGRAEVARTELLVASAQHRRLRAPFFVEETRKALAALGEVTAAPA